MQLNHSEIISNIANIKSEIKNLSNDRAQIDQKVKDYFEILKVEFVKSGSGEAKIDLLRILVS